MAVEEWLLAASSSLLSSAPVQLVDGCVLAPQTVRASSGFRITLSLTVSLVAQSFG